jgi:hypothetical protein
VWIAAFVTLANCGDREFGNTPAYQGSAMSEYQPVSSSHLEAIGQRCPRCHQPRMVLSRVESGPNNFDYRTFECQKCGRVHTSIVSSDPMESDIHTLLDDEPKQTL